MWGGLSLALALLGVGLLVAGSPGFGVAALVVAFLASTQMRGLR